MACRLFGSKPLPEPMLANCQLDSSKQISAKFESEFYHFHSKKCIWKCRLPKWRPFPQGGDKLNKMSRCTLRITISISVASVLHVINTVMRCTTHHNRSPESRTVTQQHIIKSHTCEEFVCTGALVIKCSNKKSVTEKSYSTCVPCAHISLEVTSSINVSNGITVSLVQWNSYLTCVVKKGICYKPSRKLRFANRYTLRIRATKLPWRLVRPLWPIVGSEPFITVI